MRRLGFSRHLQLQQRLKAGRWYSIHPLPSGTWFPSSKGPLGRLDSFSVNPGVQGVWPGAASPQRAPGAGGDAWAFPHLALRGPGRAGAKTSSWGFVDFPGKIGMLLLAAPRDFSTDLALDEWGHGSDQPPGWRWGEECPPSRRMGLTQGAGGFGNGLTGSLGAGLRCTKPLLFL